MNTKTRLAIITAIMLLIAAITISTGHAQVTVNSTASWTPPTVRENGDPLGADDIAAYKIYQVVDEQAALMATVSGGTTYAFAVPAGECVMLYVTAVDTRDLESKPSNDVTVCAVAPGSPTEFKVTMP